MGRLSAVAVSLVLLLVPAGCEEHRPSAGLARSEAVLASGPTGSPAPVDAALPVPPRRGPRTLCGGPPVGKPLPPGRLSQVTAPGAAALPDRLPVGHGRWTWISLWAAWCVPCKEEMPLLRRWEERLASALKVEHVSIDDDRRQLERELASGPGGVRASYWLPEGPGRDAWLKGLGLKPEPTLPVQILVGPRGQVHCIIDGSVENGDYEQVAALVARR
jgi:thiol-disulfide isomerase/thioredoxin